MKVRVATDKDAEQINLRLKSFGEKVIVEDADELWSIIEFRVEDDKLVFARFHSIEDKRYNVEETGQIVEVEEKSLVL
jgi:hypothetical protein